LLEIMRILVTFAVDAEFAPWRARRKFDRQAVPGFKVWKSVLGDSEVLVVLTGMGDNSASVKGLLMRAADGSQNFDVCVSSGLAGALLSDYQLGDIVVAKLLKSSHSHADLGRDWLETDKQLVELAVSHGAKPVDAFYTAPKVLTTAKQKSQLASKADVVEMESFDVVKEGYAWGARGVAIRAISDRADENLPIDFNRTMSSRGRVSISRVVAEVAKSPGALGPLIRFGRQSRNAAEALAAFLENYVTGVVHGIAGRESLKVAAR
jgi:adenosylhomocysteine nucleosidase